MNNLFDVGTQVKVIAAEDAEEYIGYCGVITKIDTGDALPYYVEFNQPCPYDGAWFAEHELEIIVDEVPIPVEDLI